MAALLSQCMVVGSLTGNPSSLYKLETHTISAVNVGKVLYSASAELLETFCCFFDFHDIHDFPYFNKYHVMDLLVVGHGTQSASQKLVNYGRFSALINNPTLGVVLIYLTTFKAAFQCDIFGFCRN